MPMPMPGQGGPPPPGGAPGGAPPGGTGPAMAPGHMAGNQAQAMTQLKIGTEALQKALIGIPMGSPLHSEILGALSKLGKHMQAGGAGPGDPQALIQQLALMSRDAKAQPGQDAALQGLMGGGGPPGGGAPPPPAPPAPG